MTPDDPLDITQLIATARTGDKAAEQALFQVAYAQLRRIAARRRRLGHRSPTMNTTALVNEAYLDLARRFPDAPATTRENRATFYRTVGLAMRTILRDYWRSRQAEKRGGGVAHEPMPAEGAAGATGLDDRSDFLALDVALEGLAEENAKWYEVVLHRHFAGRSIEETAELMDLSPSAVKKYWRCARAWLAREIGEA